MSVTIPDLIAGEPPARPVINFKLTQMAEGVAVEAKHSDDRSWQTILEVGLTQWGQLEVRTRDLHAPHLCEIASVEQGSGMRVVFKDRHKDAPAVLLAVAEDDKQ